MKTLLSFLVIICAGLLAGCSASMPPAELVSARQAYQHAADGQAATLVPAELHKAEVALATAEQSFKNDPQSYTTRDLSYVADRKAKLAEALATTVAGNASATRANNEYQATQTEIMIKTQKDLAVQTENTKNANESLAVSERNSSLKSDQIAAEQKGRMEAESLATSARADLAKLAAVKEEARGLVITLSGSVLFASDKSELLPEAQTRLNQVVAALLETKERSLIIEGHTDSQGSSSYNMELSQHRADAVRSYIVSRGYNGDLIQAHGIGKDRPIADNGNAEGRANNRRVEIIVAPK